MVGVGVHLLLGAGADKNMQSESGQPGLMLASSKGHVEIVRLLLGAGADKNMQSEQSGQTALMRASSKGHVEIVGLRRAKWF